MHDIVGEQTLNFNPSEEHKLDVIWTSRYKGVKTKRLTHLQKKRKVEDGKMEEKLQTFYDAPAPVFLQGQGRATRSPAEMSQFLYERDYEKLSLFTGTRTELPVTSK